MSLYVPLRKRTHIGRFPHKIALKIREDESILAGLFRRSTSYWNASSICAPNRLDNSATVPSSRTAASATFALNSEPCFFRVFDMSHPRPTGRSKRRPSLSYLSSFRGSPHMTHLSIGSTGRIFRISPRHLRAKFKRQVCIEGLHRQLLMKSGMRQLR
jgi:hypothetical protein